MSWYDDCRLHFAVGYEDTFIAQVGPGERVLDEYETTQHYDNWHLDIGLAAEAGAGMARWGVPWHRVQPGRDRFEWEWLDACAARFAEVGVTPVVDLMHYGTPLWLEHEFASPEYPELVAEYARQVATRYAGVFDVFTPLNEPLLNVIFCGEFGYWPPRLTGDDGFVTVLRGVARGIVLTERALREANPAVTTVNVEASFRFTGDLDGRHLAQATHLRERAFLVPDLTTGRVGPDHPLAPYLRAHGFTDADFAWFRDNGVVPDVMGVNYYPALSTEVFEETSLHTGGPLDVRPRRNDWTDGLQEVLRAYAERYGRPVFLTETCLTGTDEEKISWMDASVATVRRLRREGVDVVGYTWWSVFDMHEWTYRHGDGPVDDYLLPMGLWRLELDADGRYRRVRTAAADRYRELATAPGDEQPPER